MAKETKCLHGGCKLPLNNNRYLWQILFIILSFAIISFRSKSFTFFQIFLFVSPIMIDVTYGNIESNLLDWIRKVYFIVDGAIIAFCLCGIAGLITMSQDNGMFVFNIEVLETGAIFIKKKYIAWALLSNIIVPILYYETSPCKSNEKMLYFILQQKLNRGGSI